MEVIREVLREAIREVIREAIREVIREVIREASCSTRRHPAHLIRLHAARKHLVP